MLKNWEKMAKNIKIMLKIVMLKSCRTFHLIWKFFSNLFSNPRAGSLALKAAKIKKTTKIFFKKLEKKQVLSKNC